MTDMGLVTGVGALLGFGTIVALGHSAERMLHRALRGRPDVLARARCGLCGSRDVIITARVRPNTAITVPDGPHHALTFIEYVEQWAEREPETTWCETCAHAGSVFFECARPVARTFAVCGEPRRHLGACVPVQEDAAGAPLRSLRCPPDCPDCARNRGQRAPVPAQNVLSMIRRRPR